MAWRPDYVTDVELKAYVRIPDDDDDTQIAFAISAASRAIDRHCRRQFGQVAAAEARTYRATHSCRLGWLVDTDDLMVASGLLVDGVSAATDVLYPKNAAADGMPWTRVLLDSRPTDYDVEVTAQWGWSAVPDAVKEACLLQASRLFTRRDAPFGIAGSPDTGSEMRLLAKVDPDVAVSLDLYRRKARPQ